MTPDLRTSRLLGVCGIAGPIALTVYFITPLFFAWPFAGGTPTEISAYAVSHATLFYAGAWLQAVGTALSVAFFIGLAASAGALGRTSGALLVVAVTTLLALVLFEGVFLALVPVAANAGDVSTAATAFAVANGAFTRAFSVVPAPLTFLALAAVLGQTHVRLARSALVLGAAFLIASIVAIASPAGVVVIIVLSIGQSLWIWSAAPTLLRASEVSL